MCGIGTGWPNNTVLILVLFWEGGGEGITKHSAWIRLVGRSESEEFETSVWNALRGVNRYFDQDYSCFEIQPYIDAGYAMGRAHHPIQGKLLA